MKLKPNDEERLAEAQKKVKMLEEELKYGASSVQRQQLMLQQLEEVCFVIKIQCNYVVYTTIFNYDPM